MYIIINNNTAQQIPISNYTKQYIVKKRDGSQVKTVVDFLNKDRTTAQTTISLLRPYIDVELTDIKIYNNGELLVDENHTAMIESITENLDIESQYELRIVVNILD